MRKKEVFQKIDIHKTNDIMFAFDNALHDTACLVDDMNIFQGTAIDSNKNKTTVHKNEEQIDDTVHPSKKEAQYSIKAQNNKKMKHSSQHAITNKNSSVINHPKTKNNKPKGILLKK